MLEKLKQSLLNAPVIQKGDYNYFVHPITDGIPALAPELVYEVADYIIDTCNLNVDRLVTIEAMGIPIAMAVSLVIGIPLTIIRKRKYNLPGEIEINQSTGYSKGQLYINGLSARNCVTIIDDVISTGGTLKAVLQGLKTGGIEVRDIVCIIEKGKGAEMLRAQGIPIKTLAKMKLNKTKVTEVLTPPYSI